MAVAVVVAAVVVAAAAAAGTAIRTTDMVAVTTVMATRAAVLTDGNGTDDSLACYHYRVRQGTVHSGLDTLACSSSTFGEPSFHSLFANRTLEICYV